MNQEKNNKKRPWGGHEYYDCLTHDTIWLLTLIIWTLNPSAATDSRSYFHF